VKVPLEARTRAKPAAPHAESMTWTSKVAGHHHAASLVAAELLWGECLERMLFALAPLRAALHRRGTIQAHHGLDRRAVARRLLAGAAVRASIRNGQAPEERRRVPPESPQISAKLDFRACKSFVCNVRRPKAVRLLTEGL